jgi:hypothetical protein
VATPYSSLRGQLSVSKAYGLCGNRRPEEAKAIL